MDRHHAVGRGVELPRIEPRIARRAVVEDLNLAHPDIGPVAVAGVADCQPVVAGRRQTWYSKRATKSAYSSFV